MLHPRKQMSSAFLDALPEDLARRVRTAWVPPHLRALFVTLVAPLRLRVRIPDDARDVPVVATQLLKIATLSRAISVAVERGPSPNTRTEVSIANERLTCTLDLGRGLDALVREVLIELLPGERFVDALEVFASRAAKLAALQMLTSHMLRAEDLAQARHAMLSAISSGFGLGFHRAAIFELEGERSYVGRKAIGPADQAEAHRIWEAIEYEDKGLDAMLVDHAKRNVDSRFEQHVQTLALVPTAGDELERALDAPGPLRFHGTPKNAGLAALDPQGEWVVAAVRSHGAVRGVIFADDRYGSAPISEDRVGFLGFFIDQLALVWENLTLLRRVEHLARHDALTGVLTRRAFDERLAEEHARAARTKSSFALLVIDVDRFKEINDRRGHAAGDAVLRTLGAILQRDLRTNDVVGRIGGDEFAVLVSSGSEDDVASLAKRVGLASAAQGISLSVGAACWPRDCPDPVDLLAVADARLYDSKRDGRGRASLGSQRTIRFDA